MNHVLKTWPAPFAAIVSGAKRFEFRKNDRDFKVDDRLVLAEWEPTPVRTDGGGFTGRDALRWVTYVARGPAFGIPDGYCVMSIADEPIGEKP